jgi:hypothetical protein
MAAVHEHLIGCRDPHPELRELGGVLPYLATLLEPVEPPARLRAAVIAAAQADLAAHPRSAEVAGSRVATIRRTIPAPESGAVEAEAAEQVNGAMVVSLTSARRSRRRRALAWTTRVAAAAAVVAVVAYGFGVIREPGAGPSAGPSFDYKGQGTVYAGLTPQASSHAAGLAVLKPSGHLYVYVNGLAPTTGDQVYMVWVTAAKDTILAGYFTVNAQGDGSIQMDNVPRAASLWVQVCIEPNEHVTQPTGPTVASGTIFT